MAQVRDNQRSKLYASECFLYDLGKGNFENGVTKTLTPKSSIHDCQTYVNLLAQEYWFRQRWGKRIFRVESKRGGGRAFDSGRIQLGTWARNEAVVLYEVAHCLVQRERHGLAGHGPEFAGVYLFLVKQHFGKEAADQLRASFKTHKVRYNNSKIPAIDKSVKTSNQLRQETKKKNLAIKAQAKANVQKPLNSAEQLHIQQLLSRAIKSGELNPDQIVGARRVLRAYGKKQLKLVYSTAV